ENGVGGNSVSSRWQKNRDRASERPAPVDHWSGELQALCDRVCEESLSPAEAERLETLLVSDPQARAYYLELVQLHASLQWNGPTGERPMAIANGSSSDRDESNPTA